MLLPFALAACTGKTIAADASSPLPLVSDTATTTFCPAHELPSEPDDCSPSDPCTEHADCADGSGGVCTEDNYGDSCRCNYDQCQRSDECEAGQICVCQVHALASFTRNVCLFGNCTDDADCPGTPCRPDWGGWCGTPSEDTLLPLAGLYCATPADTCSGDADCEMGEGERCLWSGTAFACAPVPTNNCD